MAESSIAQLVRYDAMIHAITECHRVDEVKDLRDKAMALEMYARQAKNKDAERKASDVRLRAERRTGELLKELARDQGGDRRSEARSMSNDATLKSPYAAALDSAGLTRQTAHRYQALADVPKPVFDEALRDPERKPTTTRILAEARDPVPKMADDALWLWGRARDFERDRYANKDPATLLAGMTETMLADMRRILPSITDFYAALAEALE